MNLTLNDIDLYLIEVKDAIQKNQYRIETNSRRQENRDLFFNYVLDETMAKDILLGLTATDFSEVVQNVHIGYEHEQLFVFGKDVELLERIGNTKRIVSLYIKLNKTGKCFVIVVSLHEQNYPIHYCFK